MTTTKETKNPGRPADLPGKKEAAARVLGNCCPWCGDADVVGGPVEINDNAAQQEMTCGACDKGWTEWYDRAAVTFYEPGKGQWTDELPRAAK